jgi:hypothetical protein
LNGKRELAALKSQSRFAEQLTPPTFKGLDIRLVLAGKPLQIVGAGDKLRGDVLFVADLP